MGVVWAIINDYAKYTSSSLTIAQYDTKASSRWHHNDIMDEVLKQYLQQQNLQNDCFIKLLIMKRDIYGQHNHLNSERRDKAIWFIDSSTSFIQLEVDLLNEQNNYRRNGYFLLVYTGTEADRLEIVKKMFKRLFELYVVNINVFLPGKQTHVYTYFPYRPNLCRSSLPQLVMSFDQVYNVSVELPFFPKKLVNLYECTLVLTTWHQDPFVFVEQNETTGKVIRLHGIEGSIMSLLADLMNFSIQINNPQEPDRGVIYENGSLTGAIKMVYDGETNFTMNTYMLDKTRADYLQPALSHMSIPLTVAIPRGIPMASWERLIKPFKYSVWSLICCSILLACGVIFGIKLWANTKVIWFVFGIGNRIPFTNLLSILYTGSMHNPLAKRNFSRFLLTAWLIYTFLLRSAYLSELYYILQDGRARTTIKSISDVKQKNYTFYAAPLITTVLKETAQIENIVNIDGVKFTIPKLLKRLQTSLAQFVVVTFEPTIISFNQRELHFGRHINTLHEPILTAPLAIYMRKHSYLKHQINDLVSHLKSSGIVCKIEKLYLYKKNVVVNTQHPMPLSLLIFQDVFILYCTLVCGCIFIFLLEIWSRRSPTIRHIFDFFNC